MLALSKLQLQACTLKIHELLFCPLKGDGHDMGRLFITLPVFANARVPLLAVPAVPVLLAGWAIGLR